MSSAVDITLVLGRTSHKSIDFKRKIYNIARFLLRILHLSYIINTSRQSGGVIMVVTATEFKVNFGKYLAMLPKEDIFITKNGKTVAKVSNPNISAVDAISGLLSGKLPDSYDTKALREERIRKYALDD